MSTGEGGIGSVDGGPDRGKFAEWHLDRAGKARFLEEGIMVKALAVGCELPRGPRVCMLGGLPLSLEGNKTKAPEQKPPSPDCRCNTHLYLWDAGRSVGSLGFASSTGRCSEIEL